MRIGEKNNVCLAFECKGEQGDSWCRFIKRKDRTLEIDKVACCCLIELTPVNVKTLKNWLFKRK